MSIDNSDFHDILTLFSIKEVGMNFKTATLEQMIQHVRDSNGFTITHARNYYQKKGREDVTTKIDLARELIKLDKIQKTVDKLSNRLREIEAKTEG